ncbi:tetratricopeptide repeat protein [Dethiobacter alkaliphilus]|uniref:tetratricopeptide repeat protein n=1 Tax=Dethiobacter alkaliphilus TaxID=427926 RepID=UPI002226CA08|nr:tetratricopeptide repeat protein [Dethiobacter alkaliphilus]MCW3491328.1 tetratricopeptide repeat protein [Dethiobacter alkaliphilus]
MAKPPLIKIIILILIVLLLGSAWNIGSRLFLPLANFDALLQHGIRAYNEGQIDQAFLRFQQASEIRPNDATTHYMLAQSLEAMGREDEAMEHYQQTIELNPAKAAPYYNLAVIYNRRKDLPAAEAQLILALRQQRNFHGARLMLGGIYHEQEKYEEAVDELQRLLRNRDLERPLEIRARTFLARTYTAMEETQNAREQWQRILHLDHTNEEAQEALSKLR